MAMAKILLLTRSLSYGGAERQMVHLAAGLRSSGHEILVIAFYPGGELKSVLEASGCRLLPFRKAGRWDLIGFFFRLWKTIKSERPDIIHTFSSSHNILAAVLKRLFPTMKVVWGVRIAYMALPQLDWRSRLAYAIESWFAGAADLVISNSYAGRNDMTQRGIPEDKIIVIGNGIDTEKFFPDPAAGARLRGEWAVGTDEVLIGIVGRPRPWKDHRNFLQAAAKVVARRSDVRFVCVGDAEGRSALEDFANALALGRHVIWAGSRTDMPCVYNALDFLVSSSYAEGFPNVIGEAMACAKPCVVTDTGDSARVVDDTGIVIPPRNPDALAAGMAQMLDKGREGIAQLGQQARNRILENYPRQTLIATTEQALCDLLSD
jgi:glycosyltransferase involved in cell wall biosynthesis